MERIPNMKEYLVFLGDDFYPLGGWEDFVDSFAFSEEAIEYIQSIEPAFKWAQIVYQGKIIITAKNETSDCKNFVWEFLYHDQT